MDTDSSSSLPKVSPDDKEQSDQPLSNCILMLFESEILTDVTFRCKDQETEDTDERIHAHKSILAARSPVFRAMFTGAYKEDENEIYLSDIESKDFKVFLSDIAAARAPIHAFLEFLLPALPRLNDFLRTIWIKIRLRRACSLILDLHCLIKGSIYSDELSSEVDNLVQTLKIAHKYQINHVVDRCFSQLSENLTTENSCSLLDLALFYENEELTTSASRFIDENSVEILESEGFLEISLQCLTFILKGDTFFTDETQIFERSMEWAEKKCNSSEGTILRHTLGEAFFYLRTPAMTVKEFISCTKRKGYYTIQETEDIIEAIVNNDDEECDDILCNSRTARIPPQIDIQVSQSKHSVSCTYVLRATECMTLEPASDIILTSIQLSDLQKGGIRNQSSRYGTNHQKYDVDGRQLKATVTVEEIDIFQEYIVTAQKKPLRIELESPISLECSEDEYCLKIELEPVNMSFMELQVQTIQEGSFEDITDDSGNITIRYDSSSTCHAIVDSLTFQHLSNRDD